MARVRFIGVLFSPVLCQYRVHAFQQKAVYGPAGIERNGAQCVVPFGVQPQGRRDRLAGGVSWSSWATDIAAFTDAERAFKPGFFAMFTPYSFRSMVWTRVTSTTYMNTMERVNFIATFHTLPSGGVNGNAVQSGSGSLS